MPAPRTVLHKHFSPQTNRVYILYQQAGDLPNLEISGVKMKSSTPSISAVLEASLRELRPLAGVCLDTCGGLGYSAIAMAGASAVTRVMCFEVDANVLEAVRDSAASSDLFTNPRIELRNEDVFEAISGLPDGAFDRVFHDPPRLALAGDLYSLDFYGQLFRVLKPGGKLFHYTGSPGAMAGKRVLAGVVRRLKEAGFEAVHESPPAQGIAALKPSRRRR